MTDPLIADDGTVLNEKMINQMADWAEAGLPEAVFTPVKGRPWLEPTPMVTKSLRVPAALWDAIEKNAKANGQTVSAWAREALTKGLIDNVA